MLAKNSVSDIEKREKKVLEKKLGEMEDELKVSGEIWLVVQFWKFISVNGLGVESDQMVFP